MDSAVFPALMVFATAWAATSRAPAYATRPVFDAVIQHELSWRIPSLCHRQECSSSSGRRFPWPPSHSGITLNGSERAVSHIGIQPDDRTTLRTGRILQIITGLRIDVNARGLAFTVTRVNLRPLQKQAESCHCIMSRHVISDEERMVRASNGQTTMRRVGYLP